MKQKLKVIISPNEELSGTNRVYFHKGTFGASDIYVRICSRNEYIYIGEERTDITPGCIALNKIQRISAKATKNKEFDIVLFEPPDHNFHIQSVTFFLRFKGERGGYLPEVDGEEILDVLKKNFYRMVLTKDQEIGVFYQEKLVIVRVGEISNYDLSELGEENEKKKVTSKGGGISKRGMMIKDSKIYLKVAPKSKLKLSNIPTIAAEGLFKGGKTSFQDLGIGGLDKQLKMIFRRAFASRIYPKEVVEKFGIQHVKGILLWGPPGTGKTLIARQIGKILNTKPPEIINGPEVLNKFVGESEANIRKLFEKAEKEYEEKKEDSELHLIIFDEIDAICKSRGTVRSGTGVNDSVVNQLLSKIDGVNALNNVLIIGMTNRVDLIDEALLRSGRFEIKVEIGLPNKEGRVQIFEIHTLDMRKNGVLGEDVDIYELAEKSDNYSGAEIAGVVRSAVAFALNKHIHFDDLEKTMQNLPKLAGNVKVKHKDFMKALKEVKPSYGVKEDDFKYVLSSELIDYGSRFQSLKRTILDIMEQLKNPNSKRNLMSILLEGNKGCGKTSLAIHLACKYSGFPFVKLISPQKMIGYGERSKCSEFVKIFEEAYKSPLSIVLIDDLERLIEYIEMGPRFSNVVLQALMVVIKKNPPKERKLLVIGTTSQKDNLGELNLTQVFDYVFHVPQLSKKRAKEVEKVLLALADFEKGCIKEVIQDLPDFISIKELMLIVEMAQAKVRKKGGSGFISRTAFIEALNDTGFYK